MKRIIAFSILFMCVGMPGHTAVRGAGDVVRGAVATGADVRVASGAATRVSKAQNSATIGAAVTGAGTPARVVTRPVQNTRGGGTRVVNNGTTRANLSRAGTVGAVSARMLRLGNSGVATDGNARRVSRAATVGRAAVTPLPGVDTNTFDINYQECYDAYFSCMDQFCALADERYRRCYCSSKLDVVKNRERVLGQTAVLLQDFKDLNIAAIPKTPAEVKAMLSASEGELKLAKTRDKSSAMQKLNAINDVLTNTRANPLSTQGQLDIGGDIKQIWNTVDLISGSNIANLSGESLYGAVNSQCSELVLERCPSVSTLNMIISAYGMYIENDCSLLLASLDKQSIGANTAIRQTKHEMQAARLENYNAHNSLGINDCVAAVRDDITADTACGENFVHCADVSGLYLNRTNGAPIYTANFYKLGMELSLSGDVLTNAKNAKLLSELNIKKEYAKNSLETCRDIADSVWDEFLRQAITEIYQFQQSKIRVAKDQCMDVVNKCYDTTTRQLRDYSNIQEELLLGERLELSEEMCREKMLMCSNLYGGGANGMELLVAEMKNITDQKIAQNCPTLLAQYAKKLCTGMSLDTLHGYPYECRIYAPGDMMYATRPGCVYIYNTSTASVPLPGDPPSGGSWLDYLNGLLSQTTPTVDSGSALYPYMCWDNRTYVNCAGPNPDGGTDAEKKGFYLHGDKCYPCPDDYSCAGGTEPPRPLNGGCEGFSGSLYQKLAQYAAEFCVRPSAMDNAIDYVLPTQILADINTVMDTIRVDMARELSKECERLGGSWNSVYDENLPDDDRFSNYYDTTNAHDEWGMCVKPN